MGTSKPENQHIDKLGTLANTACVAHCALTASVPELLAALGLAALLGHEAEWVFTLLAIGIAATALLRGWQEHRSLRVAAMLGAGIVALCLARLLENSLAEPMGVVLSVVAGSTLVIGHFSNLSASRRSSRPPEPHQSHGGSTSSPRSQTR